MCILCALVQYLKHLLLHLIALRILSSYGVLGMWLRDIYIWFSLRLFHLDFIVLSLYMYLYTCVYVCMHIYIHVCICIYMHVLYTHTHMHINIYIYIYVNIYIYKVWEKSFHHFFKYLFLRQSLSLPVGLQLHICKPMQCCMTSHLVYVNILKLFPLSGHQFYNF